MAPVQVTNSANFNSKINMISVGIFNNNVFKKNI